MTLQIEITEPPCPHGRSRRLRAVTTLVESEEHTACESPSFDPNSDESRRRALDIFFENLGYSIRQRLYPKDTMVADVVIASDGRKILVNPRYPEP